MLTASTAPPAGQIAVSATRSRSTLPRWVPLTGLVCLLVVVTRQALRPLSDPDTWWHLRLGQLFREGWSLSDPGQLTPFATEPWVPTQWLPEVTASWFQETFGLAGVVWLCGAAMLVLVLAMYHTCRLSGNGVAAVLATAICLFGMGGSLSPRPHLVTYVLLAVTLGAWLRTSHDQRARWWLVPLTWVWACSHGMWFTGVAVGLAVTLGLTLDRRVNGRQATHLLAVSLLSLLAAALTPVGPRLLTAPFAVGEVTAYITEWAAPSFRGFGPPLVTAGVAAVIMLTWARRGNVPWTHLGLLTLAAGWTLLSARTVALGALMMAPLLATAVQSWLPPQTPDRITRAEKLTLGTAAGVCLAGLALLAPFVASSPAKVPNALNSELDGLPRGATVLNSYMIGGWLHWRHPEVTPVADGLTEAYSEAYLGRFIAATEARPGWRRYVESTHASTALLNTGSPLSSALRYQLGWRAIGSDRGYVLLRAPAKDRGAAQPLS